MCSTQHHSLPRSSSIGFLSFPEFEVQNNDWDVLLRDFCKRFFVFSIPTGLIAASLMKEPTQHDPYYARRALLGFGIALFTLASLMVGWGTYFSIGRNENAYQSRIGIFDWLIGHQCEGETRAPRDGGKRRKQSLNSSYRFGIGFDFSRRWTFDMAGLNLRGFVHTVASGLLLFFHGYGAEYMLSGCSMGVVYEIAFLIPSDVTNFEQV
jgi:hypothetical protein